MGFDEFSVQKPTAPRPTAGVTSKTGEEIKTSSIFVKHENWCVLTVVHSK